MKDLIWTGRPSQLINILVYLFLFWTVIIPLYSYLKTRFTIFELSKNRFRTKTGILSQNINEVELYRVRDYEIYKPILLRIFGLGNLTLITSDKSHPRITLNAIIKPADVMETFRENVEKSRKETGTKEVDFT